MLTHGHMSSAVMKTAIVSILNNRQGDTSDMDNYYIDLLQLLRSVKKILQLCIMELIETHLLTSDNQFGFKRQHETDLCIFTVKSVIKYIIICMCNNPVFTCFLDASKVYDRGSHWTLFKKLLKHPVTILVV